MTSIEPFYARPSLNIETYDLRAAAQLPGSTVEGDARFFLDMADRSGGPVLELGSGTGRVTFALAEAGVEIVGLDRSRAMLEHARARLASRGGTAGRVSFVEGDMTDFALGRRFRLVIVPFRAFMSILDPADQRRCLQAIHRHLEPDGRFVLDLFDPRLEWCLPSGPGPMPDRKTVVHPVTGHPVSVDITTRANDPFRQSFTEVWRFRELGEGDRVIREEVEELTLRWTYRHEMRYLLELTGFEVVAELGGFLGQPPAYGTEQVWVARPVGGGGA
jgi:SAM-dependent methyltransferase